MGLDDLEDRVLTVRARSTQYGIEVTWDASYAPELHPAVCDVVSEFVDSESWGLRLRPELQRAWVGADEVRIIDEFRAIWLHLRDADRAGIVVDSFGYGLVDINLDPDLDETDDDAPTLPLSRLVAAVGDEAVRRRA